MKTEVKPLPKRIGERVMSLAGLMMMSYQSLAMDMSLDGRDGLWEVACAANSWLTECALNHGIPARRINYTNGFDIYVPHTWERMAELRDQVRPRKIWFSLPCTKWCRWTAVNFNTPEKQEKLESMRRRERKMLRLATAFIIETLQKDPDVAIYWEWTFPCAGWNQHVMVQLEKDLTDMCQDWESCRVDGCCYDMMNRDQTLFLQKKWLIKTNDTRFAQAYRAKRCPRNHQHDYIQGLETSRSAYYPKKMVESIIRHCRREFAPDRHVRLLAGPNYQHGEACAVSLGSAAEDPAAREHPHVEPDQMQEILPAEVPEADVTEAEREAWLVKLRHYHRAAGHPTNRNLIHLFRDAGLSQWKLEMARDFKCETCESLKLGGSSSGNAPPAATHESYQAWQAVGFDCADWIPPEGKKKIKFVLFIDMATRLRVVHVIREMNFLQMERESTSDVIQAFSLRWLCDKPRPDILIPDNAKTFKSAEMHEFCNSINVQLALPAEKESWAHGLVESALKDIKMTASAIHLEQPALDPQLALMLACAALNSTEYTKGYSSFQWCYGKDYVITDEDERTFRTLPDLQSPMSYEALVRARKTLRRWLGALALFESCHVFETARYGSHWERSSLWTSSSFGDESGLIIFIEATEVDRR